MDINKDIFDILMLNENVTIKEAKSNPYAKYISGTSYVFSEVKDNINGIIAATVFKYADKYLLKIFYSNSGKNLSLDFDNEEDAYNILYRFVCLPGSIVFVENKDNKEQRVTQEEFAKHKKKVEIIKDAQNVMTTNYKK